MSSNAFLQSCLERAESAGMPEGEYLQVCALLKKVFEENKKPGPKTLTKEVDIRMSNKRSESLTNFTVKVTEITIVEGPTPNQAKWQITVDQMGGMDQTVQRSGTFPDLLNSIYSILRVSRPQVVWIGLDDLELCFDRDEVCKQIREEERFEAELIDHDADDVESNVGDFWRFLVGHIEKECEDKTQGMWRQLRGV